MARKNFVLPESTNEFLGRILLSIRKRSKSLKYHSWLLTVERVFEAWEQTRLETLQIDMKPSSEEVWIRVLVWEDRWIDVFVWERTKFAKWDYQYEGRLLPEYEGRAFVDAIQALASLCSGMAPGAVGQFDAIWGPMLARGPNSALPRSDGRAE